MKSKRGAMEMSVGTIVTIVLLVSVLILGIFLIQNIFSSAKGAIDLTDQQLRSEINKLFSEDKKLVIYPGTRLVEIEQEDTDGVGLGVKNLIRGIEGSQTFSYEVIATDTADCGISKEQAESWIVTGKAEQGIPIAVGDLAVLRVTFRIPTGAPLCTARFRANIYQDQTAYATDAFDVTIQAK
jgi:hypothetical protein